VQNTLDQLVDHLGKPFPKKVRDDLAEAATKVISYPESGVDA
jgi:hypothetical protein